MKTPVRTRVALAAALGVDRGTLRRYLAQGVPSCADGTFDVAAGRAWIEARGSRTGSPWRTRKLRAAALRAELSLAMERGELIPLAVVEREQVRWVDAFVSAIEAAPAKLTPRSWPPEVPPRSSRCCAATSARCGRKSPRR